MHIALVAQFFSLAQTASESLKAVAVAQRHHRENARRCRVNKASDLRATSPRIPKRLTDRDGFKGMREKSAKRAEMRWRRAIDESGTFMSHH